MMRIYDSFPAYFVERMLRTAGWPREQGFFRKKHVVNASLVALTFAQLNRTEAGALIYLYGGPTLEKKSPGSQRLVTEFIRKWSS